MSDMGSWAAGRPDGRRVGRPRGRAVGQLGNRRVGRLGDRESGWRRRASQRGGVTRRDALVNEGGAARRDALAGEVLDEDFQTDEDEDDAAGDGGGLLET